MALIGEIRKHYWLLVVVIGLALVLFILSDFQRKSNTHTNNMGVVNGDKISMTDFNKSVEQNMEAAKQQYGKASLTSEESFQIRQQTWNQKVNEILLEKQFEKLGLAVSADELNDLIRGKNPDPMIVRSFTDPQTGRFDPRTINNFLENLDKVDPAMKQRYLAMEASIKANKLSEKYGSLVANGFYVPSALAKRGYNEANETAKVRLAGLRYQTVSDSTINLTDADYQKFYDENKYRFTQKIPVRGIEYMIFEPKMSKEDMDVYQKNMDKIFQEFTAATDIPMFIGSVNGRYDSTWQKKGSFPASIDSALFKAPVGTVLAPIQQNNVNYIFKVMARQSTPDSLKASHILIAYQGSAAQGNRTREQASKLADSIYNKVKSTPAEFEKLSLQFNDDQSVKMKGGDLGWFVNGTMVPEFNTAVINGKEGEFKKVETQFGFHILKITGKKSPSEKVRVAFVDLPMEPSDKTIEKYYNDASSFASSHNTLEKFSAASKTNDVRVFESLTPDDYSIPGVKNGREIVRWAFNHKTKEGTISNVFDADGTYVVAALKSKVEAGLLPLKSIKNIIKPLVLRDKKAEILMKKLNDELAKSKDLSNIAANIANTKIDTASVSFASSNIPMFGREPKLVGQIFASKKGNISSAVKGEQAVYVFTTDELIPAPATTNYTDQKRRMEMMFRNSLQQLTSILQEKAKIKDNRILFY